MAAMSFIESSEVTTVPATLRYLQWQELYETEKPFQIFLNIPPDAKDQRESNLVFEDVQQEVRNIRNDKHTFLLDKNGFQFEEFDVGPKEIDIKNREAVEAKYLPKVEKLIKEKVKDVDQVFIFDWRVRKDEDEAGITVFDMNDPTQYLRPAEMVHVDQSPHAVINRVRLQLPNEADYLLQGRVRILNVWRPLNHPIESYPLALCDGSTVRSADLVEADHIRRRYLGSTMYLVDNKNHDWVYLDRQRPEEVTIFKNFDSDEDAEARMAPHVAIDVKSCENARPRESIEVRALVFTYPEGNPRPEVASTNSIQDSFTPDRLSLPQEVV